MDPFPSAEKDGAISSLEVGFITSFLDPLHVLLFHQLGFENTLKMTLENIRKQI